MTHCHEKSLYMWKKFRIFRVVVGGRVKMRIKINEKKCKKACVIQKNVVY